jgi:hypothetical protein
LEYTTLYIVEFSQTPYICPLYVPPEEIACLFLDRKAARDKAREELNGRSFAMVLQAKVVSDFMCQFIPSKDAEGNTVYHVPGCDLPVGFAVCDMLFVPPTL